MALHHFNFHPLRAHGDSLHLKLMLGSNWQWKLARDSQNLHPAANSSLGVIRADLHELRDRCLILGLWDFPCILGFLNIITFIGNIDNVSYGIFNRYLPDAGYSAIAPRLTASRPFNLTEGWSDLCPRPDRRS
eukprot:5406295-Pleurochrysis_carterae.AAC.4